MDVEHVLVACKLPLPLEGPSESCRCAFKMQVYKYPSVHDSQAKLVPFLFVGPFTLVLSSLGSDPTRFLKLMTVQTSC